MRPVIGMVTAGGAGLGGDAAGLIARVGAAASAGVSLIQIRDRSLDARALTRLVARAVDAVRTTHARVLVNDRLDIAIAAGAHGVHLRGDSLSAARIRRTVPPGFLIGRSVHSREEAMRVASEGGLDYLIFGTVLESASKPSVAPVGLHALARVVAAVRLPVLAIGGMSVATLAEVAATGAAGFAAIGLFAESALDQLQVTVQQASMAFDTPRAPP